MGLVGGAFAIATIVLAVYKVNDDALLKECEENLNNVGLVTVTAPTDGPSETTPNTPEEPNAVRLFIWSNQLKNIAHLTFEKQSN